MARKKSEFLRSLGIMWQIWQVLVSEILDQGGNDDDIRRIETDTNLCKEIATLIVGKKVNSDINPFVIPMSDDSLPFQMIGLAKKWRKLATHFNYDGPVAWEVKAGFTVKKHAPQAGPCYKKFQYLQNWDFNDEPTTHAIVFWIPRLLPESTSKNVDEQKELLAGLRKQFELPEHHLSSLGSVALLVALILKHYQLTGEMAPLDNLWSRTGSRRSDGDRLDLRWGEDSLDCVDNHWDECRHVSLGVFALGVEALGK